MAAIPTACGKWCIKSSRQRFLERIQNARKKKLDCELEMLSWAMGAVVVVHTIFEFRDVAASAQREVSSVTSGRKQARSMESMAVQVKLTTKKVV